MNEWHAKLDELWGDFWPATELRPLAVVDFINCIFFTRQLDETQSTRQRSGPFYSEPAEKPFLSPTQEDLRWSSFQHLDEHRLYLLFNKKDGVLDSVKNTQAYSKLRKFDDEGEGLKPIPQLLAKTVNMIKELDSADDATRNLMNEYLLNKAHTASKTRELELSTSSINTIPKRPDRAKRRFSNAYILLLLFSLTAFAASFFYFQYRKPNAASLKQEAAIQDSSKQNDTSFVLASEKTRAKKTAKAAEKKVKQLNTVQHKILKGKKESDKNKTVSNAETKGLYKIISKAYFHNEPDEATRRNAFVVHWNNSYAKLKALDEKNGFIYVVFHNHLNQTSKGWLRKKDLEPIDH